MVFVDDILTAFLGTATLLLLSLYTLINCRSQLPKRPPSYEAFLFSAGSRRQSLAGTIGYAFSLTYYGATTIYGHLYRAWFIVFLFAVLVIAILLVRTILDGAVDSAGESTGNLLLAFIRQRLGDDALAHISAVYVLIYFALLVEELAVSRVVLREVFPAHPAITAIILATICVVILAYVKWGGFRAVLIADFEQLKLLTPFVIAIAFLIFRAQDSSKESLSPFAMRAEGDATTFVGGTIMLTAWIVCSVDFYSRLNFRRLSRSATDVKNFATMALLLASLVFVVGAAYGYCLPTAFSLARTPSAFTHRGVRYAMSLGFRTTSIIFFASLFCMIFSTINTLLVTVFQIGHYRNKRPQVSHIHFVLLWAMVLSCGLWPDSVSAIGLFICALMVVPLCLICAALWQPIRNILPVRYWFVWPAVALSVILFTAGFKYFESYSAMPLLGALVLAALVVSVAMVRLGELVGRL
jgi:hypothetical protein